MAVGLLTLCARVWALGEASYLSERKVPGAMPLFGGGQAAEIYVDPQDFPGAQRAARDFSADLQKIGGPALNLVGDGGELNEYAVIIGTLGHSRLVDSLVQRGVINTRELVAWDGYLVELVEKPLPQVKQALVVVGGNKRGTSYGVYDISQQMGISPWYYWADVTPLKKKALFVLPKTRKVDAPKVKYRGIFLNDEAPALTNWVTENHGNYNHEFYAKVFELLLRLKANYLWPAMWNNAFNDDDPKNQALADEYGIVMGTSHHEPMMRADKEWNRYGKGKWEFSTNPENLAEFWRQGAMRARPYENLFTMGMRGQEDQPMSEGENIQLLQNIVERQRAILADVFAPQPVEKIPQVWCLYKEVQAYYEKGMRVPDDITLLWSDDNWGNVRRLPTPAERHRSGGAGVYYHFDYVGAPRSYRWINTVPLAKIWEQMNLAYQFGAKQIWITNVGDLKPMEFPTEYFLNLAWNPEAWDKNRIPEYTELWAEREFGKPLAKEIAALMEGYTRHNGRRKPELMSPDTYSLFNYSEAERILSQLQQLTDKAEALSKKIPTERQSAYFQLVLHPVLATANITRLNIALGKNRLYAQQGRATANQYAQLAKEYFAFDKSLKERFDTFNNGKWRHFMDQTHIGYTNWNHPEGDQLPALAEYLAGNYAEMGVAVEGISAAWPTPGNYALNFDSKGKTQRSFTLFNRGTQPFDFSVTASPWIRLSQNDGKVDAELHINSSIDWAKLPEGTSIGQIVIKGTGWQAAKISVKAVKASNEINKRARGFIEADGYVAIEAAHFKKSTVKEGIAWQEIPQHGRTLSSIMPLPVADKSFTDIKQAPYVEYPLTLFTTGAITVETVLAPGLPFVPGRGLRYAISIGDEEPKIIDFLAGYKDADANWEAAVENGARIGRSEHYISKAGPQILRLYVVDPGVTVQRLQINTGGLLPSYL
ncbi:MAG TPA: glycosyl hydrolase 115 family protein, partial [Cellvibrionaceae bacterium]|nr:glycosyl hydrolase 115 family protein [Cellvibrionaceae bacterium]